MCSDLISRASPTYKARKKKNDANYYDNNKEKIKKTTSSYRKNHSKQRQQREKDRKLSDPTYRLRSILSSRISRAISKNGLSIIKCLPYSMRELKDHLENQFEPWMTWDNYGIFNSNSWSDDDPSTWTWQIDHIIPHSQFLYTSMDDEIFRECWSLSNLRPLSAKQNSIDGASRKRHNQK